RMIGLKFESRTLGVRSAQGDADRRRSNPGHALTGQNGSARPFKSLAQVIWHRIVPGADMNQPIGLDRVFRALLLRQCGHADDSGIRRIETFYIRRSLLAPLSL